MPLTAVRARVEEARALGGEPLAVALLELAEAEPLLGHRQAAVRGPLEEAAALLDEIGSPALQGRTLLRLAHVKLADGDLEGVVQLATRARDRLDAADTDRRTEVRSLLARAAIRRHDYPAAEAELVDTSAALAHEPTTLLGRRVLAGLALAWAELALEQRDFAVAASRLDVLAGIADVDGDDLAEADFACRQARGLVALALGEVARACQALRDAVALAKRLGGVEDELESRIALAGALVERGDATAFDEAERHLQITRDTALEHGLDAMHVSALVGQVGVMSKRGQTQAALSRCIEIAETAVKKQDLPRYTSAVALMSQIYETKGDLASAYRTFAEAHATLRDVVGDQATELIRPHLAALADRIGSETFRQIAEQVNKAAHARQTFRRRS